MTKHAPLKWLDHMKEMSARVMRGYLGLQPYTLLVDYHSSHQNENADFFSQERESNASTENAPTYFQREEASGTRPAAGLLPDLTSLLGNQEAQLHCFKLTEWPQPFYFSSSAYKPGPYSGSGAAGYVPCLQLCLPLFQSLLNPASSPCSCLFPSGFRLLALIPGPASGL